MAPNKDITYSTKYKYSTHRTFYCSRFWAKLSKRKHRAMMPIFIIICALIKIRYKVHPTLTTYCMSKIIQHKSWNIRIYWVTDSWKYSPQRKYSPQMEIQHKRLCFWNTITVSGTRTINCVVRCALIFHLTAMHLGSRQVASLVFIAYLLLKHTKCPR